MRNSETVYRLTAAQLAELHEQGISDHVIYYMQQTYLDAVRQDQSLADWDYWTAGADGFWYGGPFLHVGERGRDGGKSHGDGDGSRGDGGGSHGGEGSGGHGGGGGGHGGR